MNLRPTTIPSTEKVSPTSSSMIRPPGDYSCNSRITYFVWPSTRKMSRIILN